MSRRPRIAISLGDPCGIGPELLLTSLATIQELADVTVVGCRAGIDLLEDRPGAPVAWRWVEPGAMPPASFPGRAWGLQVQALGGNPDQPPAEALWLDPTPEITRDQLTLGEGSAPSGRATVEAVRVAALLTLAGDTAALVTLPMAKAAAHLAGYDIPGHTEFLQELAGVPITRMAFVSPSLNVVLHTVHQSLRSVVEGLEAEAVAETLVFSANQFIQLTGKADLRVALCALNPHAGEQGAFGEEERFLEQAILQAEASFLVFPSRRVTPIPQVSAGQRGIEVISADAPEPGRRHSPRFFGPLPSDSVFNRASRGEFDLVVALYHDQGLIPVKLLEPARAVNLTLGLPFVRTSPDHGTAFDKAGQWVADARNFIEAATLAVRLSGGNTRALAGSHPGP
jgi:4-hydroxythreonine-4-phosphate dehydrogenase